MRLSFPMQISRPSASLQGLLKLTIQKRLAILVLMALLPCGALLGIQRWQNSALEQQNAQERKYDQLEAAIDGYALLVERAHVAFMDFALTGLDDRAVRLKQAVDTVAIAYQKALTSDVDASAASVLDALTAFNMTLRKEATALITLRKGLGAEGAGATTGKIGELLKAGAALEGALRKIGMRDTTAVNAMRASFIAASLRRHEARFIQSLDGMVDGEHLVQYDRLTKAIALIETDMNEKGQLTLLASAYLAAFESWKADAISVRSRFEEADRSFTTVAPVIEEARKAIEASRNTAEAAMAARLEQAKWFGWSAICASILLTLLVASFMARSLSRPLASIRSAMARIAAGDVAVEIAGESRMDEVGQMSRALLQLREGVKEREIMTLKQIEASSSLSERSGRIEASAKQFQQAMSDAAQRLSEAIRALNASSDQLRSGSDDLASRARSSGQAAESTRSKAADVAVAADQMSSAGREISSQIGRSAEVANRSSEQAQETRSALNTLTDSATRVGEVISLISRIAQQTNLLALNATIEAARAGEAGRGFAVVAAEVKQLATETGKAADEISRTVGDMHDASNEAILSFDMLMSGIAQLRDAAGAIASAAHEQEISIGSIAATMGSLSADAEIGAAAAGEAERSVEATSDIAASIDGMSADLTEIIVRLEDDVRVFVDELKAA